MKFEIRTIAHASQRYNTPADYLTDEKTGVTTILVSKEIGNPISIMAVAIHEMTESTLCRDAGVTDAEIDAWDIEFDKRPDAKDYAEPGDHPEAPYHQQHVKALAAEKAYVEAMGIPWDEHDKAVLSVCE